MLVAFKVQVQEWKNVLLRGKDAEQLKRYWAAFEKEEAAIQTQAAQLLKGLPAGDARERVQQFAQAHQRMGGLGLDGGFFLFKRGPVALEL
ncbi:MAG TPA: methyl-accepting chemotaxis protein, partial [Giesbergeria sp.]|nr:methyl-accepting chemotaxis protein [Giesbergeria sp.]